MSAPVDYLASFLKYYDDPIINYVTDTDTGEILYAGMTNRTTAEDFPGWMLFKWTYTTINGVGRKSTVRRSSPARTWNEFLDGSLYA